jgi:hypothetical protein
MVTWEGPRIGLGKRGPSLERGDAPEHHQARWVRVGGPHRASSSSTATILHWSRDELQAARAAARAASGEARPDL